jgi:hypothetical protein
LIGYDDGGEVPNKAVAQTSAATRYPPAGAAPKTYTASARVTWSIEAAGPPLRKRGPAGLIFFILETVRVEDHNEPAVALFAPRSSHALSLEFTFRQVAEAFTTGFGIFALVVTNFRQSRLALTTVVKATCEFRIRQDNIAVRSERWE